MTRLFLPGWYDVYEVRGAVDFPIARVEAGNPLEALGKTVPKGCSLVGLWRNDATGYCIAEIRERGSCIVKTWYARLAERVEP